MRTLHLLGRPRAVRWRWILGTATRNPARTIYGTVVATSVLAVESALELNPNLGALLLTELITVGVYWLAHVYAEYVTAPMDDDRAAAWRRLGHTAADEWALVSASFVPLLVVLLWAALGASVATAATAGLWTGVVLLFGWGVAASRSVGRSSRMSLLCGLASAAIGGALVVLKAYLH